MPWGQCHTAPGALDPTPLSGLPTRCWPGAVGAASRFVKKKYSPPCPRGMCPAETAPRMEPCVHRVLPLRTI